jgi:diphosphomevalonate decarboxylase
MTQQQHTTMASEPPPPICTVPSSMPIYMKTVSAPTNIACIKYWGKADAAFNTPINSSVSVTLDQADLRAVTTVAASPLFTQDRLWLNGVEEDVSNNKRFRACVSLTKQLATDHHSTSAADGTAVGLVTKDDWSTWKVHVSSYNNFPTAAGLASSAAGYAALVAALAQLYQCRETFPGQLSTIARQGSGSACRSLYGGFVAWRAGSADTGWADSKAEQVADENHWPELRALILVVSDAKKDTSSTDGMGTSVATSELLAHRATVVVPARILQIEEAYLAKDFEAFGTLTMRDSNQFHATCLDTYPPIFYMNDVSRRVIRLVHLYNEWAGELRVAYTFDAGPNAVLYTTDAHVVELGKLMLEYFTEYGDEYVNSKDYLAKLASMELDATLLAFVRDRTNYEPTCGEVKMMYYTKAGPGPQVLSDDEANLDPTTGQNTYHP